MSVSPEHHERPRSHAIDALRGAAIVTMFAANLAGPCLQPPHPLWLRVYGSFAAPTFVMLAGMMTSMSNRPAPLRRLLQRSALLLLLAAGIDLLCWGIDPFETFDVLYLLGLALPVAGLCPRLKLWVHALVALGIIVVTPWLHRAVGYGPLLPDHLAYPWPAWRRLLVDGWFPVFPWLGVALLGGMAGRLNPLAGRQRRWLVPLGGALTALGVLAWWWSPPAIVTRMGYSELFYPPSPQYLSIALGAVLLMLALFDALERRFSLAWLVILGRASLMMYVVHVALIAFVLDEWFEGQTLPAYLALYAVMAVSLWTLAWATQRFRRSRKAPRARIASVFPAEEA
ncbi:MAG TPA: heparan-alpha-glucosaminide N-acetyltransferase domain-containing protein [Polyangiaceae bacterium]|nr:heparan-alpha-glucosaminide N-acetyltransferase domain-containing protein [Polyangiaceae bacterium]